MTWVPSVLGEVKSYRWLPKQEWWRDFVTPKDAAELQYEKALAVVCKQSFEVWVTSRQHCLDYSNEELMKGLDFFWHDYPTGLTTTCDVGGVVP